MREWRGSRDPPARGRPCRPRLPGPRSPPSQRRRWSSSAVGGPTAGWPRSCGLWRSGPGPSSSSRAWRRTPATSSRAPCSRTRPRSRPSCRARASPVRTSARRSSSTRTRRATPLRRPSSVGQRPAPGLRSPGSCRSRWRAASSRCSSSTGRGCPSGRRRARSPPRPPPTSPSRCGSNGRRQAGQNGQLELSRGQLELLGEALAAGANEDETAAQIVKVAAEAAEAAGATLWRLDGEGARHCSPRHGFGAAAPDLGRGRREHPRRARRAAEAGPVVVGSWHVHTIPLGEPPAAVLRLAFDRTGPGRARPRQALPVRHRCGARTSAEPAGRRGGGRAPPLADARRRRQPGDRAALARPHSRYGGRAGRRAGIERARRRLPP